jgi:hypothetical protein
MQAAVADPVLWDQEVKAAQVAAGTVLYTLQHLQVEHRTPVVVVVVIGIVLVKATAAPGY